MDPYDIERYNKVHVWLGTSFAPDAEYLSYFELDYSVEFGEPGYKVCEFCKDVGISWYDEDFIGIIPRSAHELSLDEILQESCVAPEELPRLKAACAALGITRANAIFWYSDGGVTLSKPLKPHYNGLSYIGLFEGS